MKYKNKQHFEEEGNLYNNSSTSNIKIFHSHKYMYLCKIILKTFDANHKKSNNWSGWSLPAAAVLIFPNF